MTHKCQIKIIKLLEYNIGEYLHDLKVRKGFLNRVQKTKHKKNKNIIELH